MTHTQPGGRRRTESRSATKPVHPHRVTRPPRMRAGGLRSAVAVLAGVLWIVGTLATLTAVVDVSVPTWIWRPAAAMVLVVQSALLVVRVGGLMRVWLALAVAVALAGLSGFNLPVAMAACMTAVIGAVSAIMLTRPAETTWQAVRELLVAVAVACNAAVAVAAWNAPIDAELFTTFVGVGAAAVVLLIIWSLGAGLHGLTRQYRSVLVGVGVVAVVVVVYGGVLRSYSSPGIRDSITDLIIWLRHTIGGVPRPFEVLIGFPAIIVGSALRSRYREGWWLSAFGVFGTMVITAALVSPGALPSYFAISTIYSVILGLGVGLLARRLVLSPRSARAARAVQPPHREEPARFEPLR